MYVILLPRLTHKLCPLRPLVVGRGRGRACIACRYVMYMCDKLIPQGGQRHTQGAHISHQLMNISMYLTGVMIIQRNLVLMN